MLHDFYLYDWHDTTFSDLHGLKHPKIAAENAEKYFRVHEDVRHIIESHMWPLTLFAVPKTKEAWIVCIADKIVSIRETTLGKVKKTKKHG